MTRTQTICFIAIVSFFFMTEYVFLFLLPEYGTWVDRDMLRAVLLFEDWQTMGAELNGTYYARTPGGAYYYVLGLLSLFSHDSDMVTRILLVLTLLTGLAVYIVAVRVGGLIAGVVALLLWLSSPIMVGTGYRLYNPAIGVPFLALGYLFLYQYVYGKPWALPLFVACIGVAMQGHISFGVLLLTGLFSVVLLRPPSLRTSLLSVAALLLVYAPYLIEELLNDFLNFRLIYLGRDEVNAVFTALKPDSLEFFLRNISNPICFDDAATCNSLRGGGLGSFRSFYTYAGTLVLAVAGARAAVAMYLVLKSEKPAGYDADRERLLSAFGIIVALGMCVVTIGRGFAFQYRYFAFMMPALAVLFGAAVMMGITALRDYGPMTQRVGGGLATVVIAFLTLGSAKDFTLSTLAGAMQTPTHVETWRGVLATLNAKSGMDHEDIKRRTLYVYLDGLSHEQHVSYLARGVAPTQVSGTDSADDGRCWAIVFGTDENSARAHLDVYMSGAPVAPTEIEFAHSAGEYHLYSYRLDGLNCYKSVGTSYDHFPEEKIARAQCDKAGQDGVVWQQEREGRTQAVVRDTFERVRLCFWVEFEREQDRLVGTLHAWQGRSYSGYPIDHWTFTRLNLSFENGPDRVDVPLINQPLGRFNYARMPWNFSVDAPAEGDHLTSIEYDMVFLPTERSKISELGADPQTHVARHNFREMVQLSK